MIKANGTETHFAEGTGWTVATAENPMLQMQMTNEGGGLLKYSMENPTPPPADLPGQKQMAERERSSLSGDASRT